MKSFFLTLVMSCCFSFQAYSLDFTGYQTPFEVLAKAYDEAGPAKFEDLLHTGAYEGINWVDEDTIEVYLAPEPSYFVIRTFAKITPVPARNAAGPLFPKRDEDKVIEKVYAEILGRSKEPGHQITDASKLPNNFILEKLKDGLFSEETEQGLVTTENQYTYLPETSGGTYLKRRLFVYSYRISPKQEIIIKYQVFKKNDSNEYELLSTQYTYNWKNQD